MLPSRHSCGTRTADDPAEDRARFRVPGFRIVGLFCLIFCVDCDIFRAGFFFAMTASSF
jgi:hypothetical protein